MQPRSAKVVHALVEPQNKKCMRYLKRTNKFKYSVIFENKPHLHDGIESQLAYWQYLQETYPRSWLR